MVEEGHAAPETPSETPSEEAGTPAPSIIDAEGKFTDKWRESLPEDIRNESYLNEVKDIQGLARSVVHARRMVGKNKIAIPNENSTEAEREEFFKACGRPDSAAGYNITRPQDLPEEHWNPDFAQAAMDLFFGMGLSAEQAKVLVEFNNANVIQAIKNEADAKVTYRQESQAALQNEWGDAYAQKIHLGDIAIDQAAGGDEEFRQAVADKYGDDPLFIRFASNLGSKFVEHGTVSAGAMVPTPQVLKDQVNELMKTDAYINVGNPEHKAMVQKVQRIFLQMRGEKPYGHAETPPG